MISDSAKVELLDKLKQADRHQAAGEHERELALIDEAILLDPAFPGAHLMRYSALISMRRVDEAEESIRTVHRLDPANATACILLAQLLQLRGEAGQAEDLYQSVLSEPLSVGDEVLARRFLAELVASQRRPEEALAQIDQAIHLVEHGHDATLAAELPILVHLRGLVLFELDRVREAASSMRRFVELRGDSARGWYDLAGALSILESYEDSMSALQRACGLDPALRAEAVGDADLANLRKSLADRFEGAIAEIPAAPEAERSE